MGNCGKGGRKVVLRFILGLVIGIFLAGCSLTQKPSAVSQLQIKVSQLENQLNERDQEINDLKYEISELSNQLDTLESSQTNFEDMPETASVEVNDKPSVTALDIDTIIRVSASVQDVQTALKAAGYYEGAVDGKVGKKTKSGIEQFQREHNLKADGIVGKKTWAELKTYLKE